ncbi:MAG TPA: hypothetical protein VKR24_03160 [Candidatus Limnocylindrales bacterium]|nr:hypothetical protein [Candidatus Limnocylindrales bacterium]
MQPGSVARETSAALREASADRLQAAFAAHVAHVSASATWDARDEMLSLTPFVDCARRLGADPAILFGPIAADGAPWLQRTFDSFVRRPGITLAAFGWSIVETADGPAYEFHWPSWSPKQGR